MALTVNTNVPALNAQRNLEMSGIALNRSLQRLSSGLRVNSAADDAAGLAISTRLGAQIRGLNQAIRNANDGLGVLQTAEGAMSEITSIVTRIKELAVQSANSTNSATDRTSLNDEVTSLLAEVTRIATQTKFGSTAVLDGTFAGTFQVGVEAGQTISQSIASMKASSLNANVGTQALTLTAGLSSLGAADANSFLGVNSTTDLLIAGPSASAYARLTVASDDGVSAIEKAQSAIALAKVINEQTSVTGVSATVGSAVLTVADNAERFDTINIDGVAESVTINGTSVVVNLNAGTQAGRRQQFLDAVNAQVSGVVASAGSGNGGLVLTAADGRNISIATIAGVADGDAAEEIFGYTTAPTTAGVAARGTVTLQASGSFTTTVADAAEYTGEGAATAVATALSTVSVSTISAANTAMLVTDTVLNTISSERGKLGATQNRLQVTIANIGVVVEKVSEARSRILDADFAQETAALTRAQILQQAGIAILAQANAAPQAALTLLRG